MDDGRGDEETKGRKDEGTFGMKYSVNSVFIQWLTEGAGQGVKQAEA